MIYIILILLLSASVGFNVYSMWKSKLFFTAYKKDLERIKLLIASKKTTVSVLFKLGTEKKFLEKKVTELEHLLK